MHKLLGVKASSALGRLDGYNLVYDPRSMTGFKVFVKFFDADRRKLLLTDVVLDAVDGTMYLRHDITSVKSSGFARQESLDNYRVFIVVFGDRITADRICQGLALQ